MRVVIEALSSQHGTLKKMALRPGQSLKVGRTEWADVAFPHDQRMSGVHFLLETDEVACYVTDLGSSNGTLLGGVRINQRTRLRDREEFLAGDTAFVVRIEGDFAVEQSPSPAATPRAAAPLPDGRDAGRVFRESPAVSYTEEKCDSGLTLCRGSVAEIAPADLAVRLCRLEPIYLIVDFKRLGIPLPEELAEPAFLFDWFEPAVAATVSPVIVSQQDLLTWPSVVEQGWGNDAVICLLSKQEPAIVVEHLRRACRGTGGMDSNASILGYCWPSVLGPLLSHQAPESVQRLLVGIDAVLTEWPDLPDTWQIYGTSQVVETLDRLGFRSRQAAGGVAPT
jgi:hypothetical protein